MDNIETVAEKLNKDVATSISDFFRNINVDKSIVDNTHVLVWTLVHLGSFSEEDIKNIERLGKLDVNVGKAINDFISSIDFSKIEALQDKQLRKSMGALQSFMTTVMDILNKTNLGFKTLFLPIKGRLIGRAIANFFEEIVKAVPKEKIELEISGLGELMSAFYPLIEKDGKYSITKLLTIMNETNGHQIGSFFKAMIEQIPKEKEVKDSINSVKQFLEFIKDFGLKDYMKMRLVLTEKNGEKIGKFFEAIIVPLKEKDYPDLKPITDFLKSLSSIGILGVLTLALMKPILTPKFGESISGFITKLVDSLDEEKMERLKGFSAAMKNISAGILMMTGSIVLLAAAIEFFGAMTVIGATVIAVTFVGAVLLMLKMLKDSSASVKEGTAALQDVAKVLLLMTADIYLLVGAALLMKMVDWEEIGKVAVMMVAIGIFMGLSLWVADKWNKGGENAQKAIIGVSILLLASAAAIAIAVSIAKNNDIGELALGLGMLALVIVGSYFMVTKLLEKANKDYDDAIKNIVALVAILGATALVARFLLAPLAEHMGEIIVGGVLVMAIIGIMVAMVKWLAKTDPTNLKQATIAISTMTAIVAIISVIALFGFTAINDKAGDIFLGGVVVFGIITVMSLIVWGLSKIDPKDLEQARNAILAEAVILGTVSLIAAFLLVPIGQNMGDVLLGFVTVGIIIAALIGATYLLAKVDDKDLSAATNAILAISALILVVSLVSLLLFIPIGRRADEVGAGAFIVMGIIAVMAGIVWILSKCEEDNLKMATITMAVVTAILLTVSIIALTLFIPIADQWDSVSIGAVIVLVVIAAMVGMVHWMSKIKKDNLLMATVSLAVMTFILLGVSLIAKEILIPIGYEAEEALYGAGIVVGLIGSMGLAIYLLSKVEWKELLAASLAALGIALVLGVNAWVVSEYIIPVGEDAEAAALGSAVILGTVAVMGLIVWGLSKIPKEELALGALAVVGIGAILWSLGELMPSYIEMCKMMYENGGEVALGGLELVATLVAWGAILWAVGALSEVLWVIALGAAIVEPIALLLWQLGETMPSYIDLCILLHRNIEEVTLGGLELAATLTAWSIVFTIIATVGALGVVASPFIAVMVGVIYGITKMMNPYIEMTKKANQYKDVIKNGTSVVKQVLNDMTDIMTGLGKTFLNPFTTIAMTAGVAGIAEIAAAMLSLNLIVKAFGSISETLKKNNIDLGRVREVVDIFTADKGLVWAIEDIIGRMDEVGIWATAKAGGIAMSLKPVFSCLSDFIKIIVDALNMRYVDEWDENGKPKTYMKVTPEMYAQAGILISAAFGYFLTELGKGMEALKDVSASTMLAMGFAIRPIIEAVSQFTEAVLSVLTAAIPYEWDENGKPKKFRKFDPTDFSIAATVISTGFGEFIRTLGPAMNALGKEAAEVIAILGQGIQPLMEAVAKFTDMIFGFQNGKEMTYTDEKGNRVTKLMKIDPTKFKESGEQIANAFVGFVTAIYDEFSKENYQVTHWYGDEEAGSKLVQVLKSLENIGTLIDHVNSFIDMVAKSVEKSKEFNIKDKGVVIANALISFTNTLVTSFSEREEIVEKTADAMSQVNKLVKKTDDAYGNLVKLVKKMDEAVTVTAINTIYQLLLAAVEPTDADGNKINMDIFRKVDVKDIAKIVPYLKKVNEAAKLLNKISEIYENKDAISGAIKLFMDEIKNFNDEEKFKRPDITKVAVLPRYMKYVLQTARLMNELAEVMANQEITNAITKFLTDIDMLTQADLQKRTEISRRALGLFGKDLRKFTVEVKNTQKHVVTFTAKMNKATDALRKFDQAIINREKERNESLKKFGDLVETIAKNMQNLNTQINSLDHNKIMENFRGIGTLFQMVLGRSNEAQQQQQTQQQQQSQQQTQQQRQGQQSQQRQGQQTQVVQNMPRGRQVINVYFADTTLAGFAEITT